MNCLKSYTLGPKCKTMNVVRWGSQLLCRRGQQSYVQLAHHLDCTPPNSFYSGNKPGLWQYVCSLNYTVVCIHEAFLRNILPGREFRLTHTSVYTAISNLGTNQLRLNCCTISSSDRCLNGTMLGTLDVVNLLWGYSPFVLDCCNICPRSCHSHSPPNSS